VRGGAVGRTVGALPIRHLPVLEEGVPVGMDSDRDLPSSISWWKKNHKHPGAAIPDWADRLPVAEVMSKPLVCLSPDESLEKVARLMLNKKISAVPLVGQTRLLGIVTETDFL
jgi:signal-transduction protein with cAMP-binding, CBS, and nucleotidyltransferase domain